MSAVSSGHSEGSLVRTREQQRPFLPSFAAARILLVAAAAALVATVTADAGRQEDWLQTRRGVREEAEAGLVVGALRRLVAQDATTSAQVERCLWESLGNTALRCVPPPKIRSARGDRKICTACTSWSSQLQCSYHG